MSTFSVVLFLAAAAWMLWLGCRGVWHTAAYYGSLGAGPGQINALNDGILRIDQTNGFFIPQPMLLVWSYLTSALIQRGYLSSPKIVQTNPTYIRPVSLGPATPANPPLAWGGPNFISLRANEDLLMYYTNSGAGPSATYGLISVADKIDPLPAGEIYTIYATGTTAVTAHTWTQEAYTLANFLPAGQYALVGSDCQNTNAVAHRWTIPNQYWRPGFLSQVLLTDMTPRYRQEHLMGSGGLFYQSNLPNLEILANGADAAFDIYMDVVKVG